MPLHNIRVPVCFLVVWCGAFFWYWYSVYAQWVNCSNKRGQKVLSVRSLLPVNHKIFYLNSHKLFSGELMNCQKLMRWAFNIKSDEGAKIKQSNKKMSVVGLLLCAQGWLNHATTMNKMMLLLLLRRERQKIAILPSPADYIYILWVIKNAQSYDSQMIFHNWKIALPCCYGEVKQRYFG
jgi:hypothetical protein